MFVSLKRRISHEEEMFLRVCRFHYILSSDGRLSSLASGSYPPFFRAVSSGAPVGVTNGRVLSIISGIEGERDPGGGAHTFVAVGLVPRQPSART